MIVVDQIQHYPGVMETRGLPSEHWAHLMSDQEGEAGEAELLAFARAMGLKPAWVQHKGRPTVHFDVTRSMRARAIKFGAVEVDSMAFARQQASRLREGQADG